MVRQGAGAICNRGKCVVRLGTLELQKGLLGPFLPSKVEKCAAGVCMSGGTIQTKARNWGRHHVWYHATDHRPQTHLFSRCSVMGNRHRSLAGASKNQQMHETNMRRWIRTKGDSGADSNPTPFKNLDQQNTGRLKPGPPGL